MIVIAGGNIHFVQQRFVLLSPKVASELRKAILARVPRQQH
jgi:hypothetical protein